MRGKVREKMLGYKEKNGRGRKDASGKTHGVGAGREKQVRKPRCGVRKQAKK